MKELLKEHWSIGEIKHAVIAQRKILIDNVPNAIGCNDPAEFSHFGGYLICESVRNSEQALLISQAPELLRALNDISLMKFDHGDHMRRIANEALNKIKQKIRSKND